MSWLARAVKFRLDLWDVVLTVVLVGEVLYRPAARGVDRQQILEYFARHGYSIEGLRSDRENLFFKPLDPAPGRAA